MDLALTEEQQMIKDTAAQFATEKLALVAEKLDREGDTELFVSHLGQLAELGFMGLTVDAQYSGAQAGTVAFSLAITELAKACASTAVTVSVTNMVAEVIQAVGNEQQKHYYLPKLCGGECVAGSFCLTEAGAGSDPASMSTRAHLENGMWVLNGSKLYITSAEYAGVFVVWAVTDQKAAKGKGISCFLLDSGTEGLIIGKAERKMGQHASLTNEVIFDDCRIPENALLGELNQGFRVAVGELAGGRIGIGSLALGIAQAAIDYARDYSLERKQFGQAIANFQGLQWMMSEAYTELEAARLLLMNAAYLKDSGKAYGTAAAMAKLFATEKANKVCYQALQILGGAGYLKDHPLERYARDARVTTIYEGSSEIQKLIIARDLLRRAG